MNQLRGPIRKEREINFNHPRETGNGQEVAKQISAWKNVYNSSGEKKNSASYMADSQIKGKENDWEKCFRKR